MSQSKNTFHSEARWYFDHVGSLYRMLPTFVRISGSIYEQIKGDFDKLIEGHAEDCQYDDDGDLQSYVLDVDYTRRHRTLQRAKADTAIFSNQLPRMAIVTLVSIYDAFLGRLLRAMFKAKPELLNGSGRVIPYAELIQFDSMEDAAESIIEQEIDELLRKSHTEQIDWIGKRTGIALSTDFELWPTFIEVTERRNLFVHADGRVNKSYLNACAKAGLDQKEIPPIGESLLVDPGYYKRACLTFIEIGLRLCQVIWRKLCPSELSDADDSLIEFTYDLLILNQFETADRLAQFGTTKPVQNFSSESHLFLKVNRAIALKECGKEEDLLQILDEIDWSALSNLFKLAESVLREDWRAAADLVREIGDSARPDKGDYKDWPLFNAFRKTDHFRDAYRDVFGEEFRFVHSGLQENQEVHDPSEDDEEAQQKLQPDAG